MPASSCDELSLAASTPLFSSVAWVTESVDAVEMSAALSAAVCISDPDGVQVREDGVEIGADAALSIAVSSLSCTEAVRMLTK